MFLAFGVPGSNVVEKEQGKRFRKNNGTIKLSLPLGIQGARETFPLFNLLSLPPTQKKYRPNFGSWHRLRSSGRNLRGKYCPFLVGKWVSTHRKRTETFFLKPPTASRNGEHSWSSSSAVGVERGGGEILLLVNFLQLTPKENGVKWRERIFIIFH